jgi:hypothetical protein
MPPPAAVVAAHGPLAKFPVYGEFLDRLDLAKIAFMTQRRESANGCKIGLVIRSNVWLRTAIKSG